MANSVPVEQLIANATLVAIKANMVAAKLVSRDYESEVTPVGRKIFVNRKPRLSWRSGSTYSAQDLNVGQVEVKLDTQGGVDYGWSSFEGVKTITDALRNDAVQEAGSVIASNVDKAIIDCLYQNSCNSVGTLGNAINTTAKYAAGTLRLEQMLVPQNNIHSILTSADAQALSDSLTNHPSLETEAREAIKMNRIPIISSAAAYRSNNAGTFTTGDFAGTPLVNGAGQNVTYAAVKDAMTSNLITDGWTSGKYMKVGDIFTIAGVNAVNERTGQSLGFLKQFVVREVVSTSVANATYKIYPAMISSGQYKNVDVAAADNAAITVLGTANTAYNQNIMFHKNAATLVVRDLEKPTTGIAAFATDKETGLALRIWRFSDGVNDLHQTRFDILYGVTSLQGELSTRLAG